MLRQCKEMDRDILDAFLNEEYLYNTFILSDIEHYGFGNDFQTVYASFDENDNCRFVYLIFHNIMILAGQTEHLNPTDLTDILDDNTDIIMGKASLIAKVNTYVSEDYDYAEKSILTLTDDRLLLDTDEPAVTAEEADAEKIHTFLNSVKEFKGMYTSLDMIRKRLTGNEGHHIFYAIDDEIIAHGNTAATTENSCFIGGLATAPAHQNQRYAKHIVSQLSRESLDKGITPCLLTAYHGGSDLFESLGFKQLGSWATLNKR